jgi:hypothetical protein
MFHQYSSNNIASVKKQTVPEFSSKNIQSVKQTVHFFHSGQITGFDLAAAVKHFADPTVTGKSENEIWGILREESTETGAIELYKTGQMTDEEFCKRMASRLGLSENRFKQEWVSLIDLFFTKERLTAFKEFCSRLEKNGDALFIMGGTNPLQHLRVCALLKEEGINIKPIWFLSYEEKISADRDPASFREAGVEALDDLYPYAQIKDHLDNKDKHLIESLIKSMDEKDRELLENPAIVRVTNPPASRQRCC